MSRSFWQLQFPRALAVPALVFTALLSANAAQAQTKIVAGMVAHGPPQWPQYIAEEFGWLKQDKIDLDLVTVGGGGAQQVAGGSLNIAHSGYPDFARAALQNAPVKIIISDFIGSPYAIFAKKTIKQIADLKGKLISIGGINDITLIYIKPFLASAGLKTSDVDFVYAKAAGDRFAALVSGGVDATILNPPTYFKAIEPRLYRSRRHQAVRRGHSVHGLGCEQHLGGAEPGRADSVRARLQASGEVAVRSGQQAEGRRHSGQAREAGPPDFQPVV